MSNLHVYIEVDERLRPRPGSARALRVGRRIASAIGATLYAVAPAASIPDAPGGVAPTTPTSASALDDLCRLLAENGADRILLVLGLHPGLPPFYPSLGPCLEAAWEARPPALVLLSSTAVGRNLGPRLAARMGALYLAEPEVEIEDGGRALLRWQAEGAAGQIAGDDSFQIDLLEQDRPVVVTLVAHPASLGPGDLAPLVDADDALFDWAVGDDEVDVVILQLCHPIDRVAFETVASVPDPVAALELQDQGTLVIAGEECVDICALGEVAEALGGQLVGTQAACRAGVLPAERAIGACGPRLFPRLYVCCGLVPTLPGELGIGGVPVAVVLDGSQDSQWLGVADYILRGDPAKTLPALLEAMRRPEAAVGQPDPQTSTADGTAATREP